MKKLLSALLAVGLIAGCSAPTTNEEVKPEETKEEEVEEVTEETGEDLAVETQEGIDVNFKFLAPTGAPALTLLPVELNGGNATIDTVEGPDALQAAFVNPTPEYDVIVAPTNLGVKLAQAEKTGYKLLAVVDWGNLYLVGTDEAVLQDANEKVLAFGQDAVPGKVYSTAYPELQDRTEWFGAVSDVVPALIQGQANVGLLAEPAATGAIAQSKDSDRPLKVLESVQAKWGEEGFPMAGFFVKADTYEENKDQYDAVLKLMADYATKANEDASFVVADLNSVGVEKYIATKPEVVGKCYNRMGVNITKASESKDAIAKFMQLFDVASVDKAIIE